MSLLRKGRSKQMNAEVDAFMRSLRHPLKSELALLREIVVTASPKIDESIKWSVPTFTFKGNMASLMVRTKKFAHLVFHEGVTLPDPDRILEGTGAQIRSVKLQSIEDIEHRRHSLQRLVRAWVKLQLHGES